MVPKMNIRIYGSVIVLALVVVGVGCGGGNSNSSMEDGYQSSKDAECEQARQEAYNELRDRGFSESDAQTGVEGVLAAAGC